MLPFTPPSPLHVRVAVASPVPLRDGILAGVERSGLFASWAERVKDLELE
jgi:hypothetical protein